MLPVFLTLNTFILNSVCLCVLEAAHVCADARVKAGNQYHSPGAAHLLSRPGSPRHHEDYPHTPAPSVFNGGSESNPCPHARASALPTRPSPQADNRKTTKFHGSQCPVSPMSPGVLMSDPQARPPRRQGWLTIAATNTFLRQPRESMIALNKTRW